MRMRLQKFVELCFYAKLAFVGGQEEWAEGPLFGIGSSARQANQNELKNKKNLDKTFSFMRII